MGEQPVGVFIATATAPEKIGTLARTAEQLGYSEVWVAEDYFCYGGFTASALALGATDHVKVGLGIVASVARHPAVTAMEIATLARMWPGRFMPGLGHGVRFWTDQMGLTAKSPLAVLKESLTGIRRLLAGETLDGEGSRFAFHSVALTHLPSEEVPIYTGVLGPKSLRLSGEIADGTVGSVLAGPTYIRAAITHIRQGMHDGGRTSHLLPTFALFSVNRDRNLARAAVRPAIAFYLAAVGPQNALSAPCGYNDQLAEMLEQGGVEFLQREMPDEWVDELAISGNPDEVGARINALLAAGATSVVLSPVDPSSAVDELRLCASSVLSKVSV
jgi:alkanesulfonate monooxygenase SsuD/methylene tetrahydromethanopterin reductase-like flavin-dependent oxidoreductase (luciferase family)